MQLVVITTPDFWPGEIQSVCALFDAGLSLLHLRKPSAAAGELAAWLDAVPESLHHRIVLHDHFELLERYPQLRSVHLNSRYPQLCGVHLNSRYPQAPACRTEVADSQQPTDSQQSAEPRQLQVSCSCHSLREVAERKPACSYVFLSPIFDSISKQGYGPTLTDAALQQARQQGIVDNHVYALGGISLDRLEQVAAYGFGGAAVLGDLWQYRSSTAQLLEHFARLKSAADALKPQPPVVLSIAGSDCSGGAGIQADIKTISALGAYAASVITAVTVQNTCGVQAVNPVPAPVVAQQIDAVMSDLPVQAIKIGMICDDAMALTVAERLAYWRSQGWQGAVVYDSVMVSTSGRRLMDPSTLQVVSEKLFPQCTLITPNLNEAEVLVGRPLHTLADMERAAEELRLCYGCAVLVKGGHLSGSSMCDVLSSTLGQSPLAHFASPKIETRNLHGTGCTLSSAIATRLALGDVLPQAVSVAKEYMNRAIEGSRLWHIGAGNGPLSHFAY